MKEKFLQHLRQFNPEKKDQAVLLAVSGGMDSVAMLHLFLECNIPFAVAHCNFQLRGKESDEDELLVKSLAEKADIQCHIKKFQTEDYARENNISIQLAARKLRYDWFEELAEQYHYQAIATAHHADDAVETFFINLLRGTGIKGLSGIPKRNGKVIRPMLCFTREEITEYTLQHNIQFRNDSSNDEIYYLRNQLRHLIMPVLQQIQPQFQPIMKRNLERLNKESNLLQQYTEFIINEIVTVKDSHYYLNINKILHTPDPTYFLQRLLEKYGFTSSQMDDIYNSLHSQPGKIFETRDYRLIKDRSDLIIEPKSHSEQKHDFLIDVITEPCIFQDENFPGRLQFLVSEITDEFTIDKNEDTAQLDYEKVVFPLIIRKWRPGDSLKPLGMKGRKKVSDLLTDLKLSLIQKEDTYVICSGSEIIWVPGIKMDDRYKITKKTRKYLQINLLNT